ncbi:HAMP domain-containing histidine kinase [Hymenobacter sp. BT635]|uniref:histidine kinase n=1 Tax=Hymenobacter nitidus TaxID=2880929 RepID=A0ABS8ADJ9_9BACT|nr:HAMP domain-containing sensor histidine kinase [Hymenobacter nitidus]MCB2378452.1 HAMP domain-containing histidine kinase [Hymenobacter nitidus]
MLVRNKLILRFMALVFAIQLCLTAFIYYYSARARELRFYHRLEGKATQTASLLIRRLQLDSEVLRSFRKKDLLTMHNERISLYDSQRRLVFHLSQEDEPAPARDAEYFDQITRKKPARFREGKVETLGILYRYKKREYLVFVAGRDQFGGREFDTLTSILLWGNLGALVLIIGAAWLFADRSLRPLQRMVAEVKGITASNLKRRVDEGNRQDEIAQLAMTFNQMLSGLEQAFENQKSFVAHASHELRTPLATVLGTLETASAYDTDLPAAKRSIDSAVEEIQKIIDLTNGLLALAKADDTSFRCAHVSLDDVVLQAVDACKLRYPGRPIQVDFGPWPEAVEEVYGVRGNAQLLHTAVLNLLDNACKYSEQAVLVALSYPAARTVQLTISDTGPGLPPDEAARILEPLYRGRNGLDKPGYGLGLAITSKIVQVHAGQLTIDSREGAGTRATVRLPAL